MFQQNQRNASNNNCPSVLWLAGLNKIAMTYKTEIFDLGYERGQYGPTFNKLDEAVKWCKDVCSMKKNESGLKTYMVYKSTSDPNEPIICSCVWNSVDNRLDDNTEKLNNQFNLK